MNLQGMRLHFRRLSYQLGKPLTLGGRAYRLRGYCANRLAGTFEHELHMIPVLERVLGATTGAFVDVGVNVGQTLMKVLAIDPSRAYVGFEPQIECCFFVNQFLADNALGHARVIALALSNENRICSLFSNSSYDDMASISGASDCTGQIRRFSTLVPARVGDEALEEIGLRNIGVIKIDVEGAELNVLSGLVKVLSTQRPVVIFEVLPNFFGEDRVMLDPTNCARNSATANKIYDLLETAGYRISQIDERGDEREIDGFDLDDRQKYVGHDFIARPLAQHSG